MEITFGFPGVGPITHWQLGKGRDSDSMISILMYYPLPHGDYTAWWSRLNRNPRGRNCPTYTLASLNSNWSQPSFSKNPHPLPPSPFLYTAASRPFHYVLYPTIQRIWISDTFTIWCKASLLWPFPVPTPPFKLEPQGNPNSAVPRGIMLSLATRTSQMLFSKPVGLIIDRVRYSFGVGVPTGRLCLLYWELLEAGTWILFTLVSPTLSKGIRQCFTHFIWIEQNQQSTLIINIFLHSNSVTHSQYPT